MTHAAAVEVTERVRLHSAACTPESAAGGPLARLRDGDLISLDCDRGTLEVIDVDLGQPARLAATAGRRWNELRARPVCAAAGADRARRLGRLGMRDAPAARRGARGVTLDDLLDRGPVIPVVALEDAAHGVPLALSLGEGGLATVEVTSRTAAAFEAIERIWRAI